MSYLNRGNSDATTEMIRKIEEEGGEGGEKGGEGEEKTQ